TVRGETELPDALSRPASRLTDADLIRLAAEDTPDGLDGIEVEFGLGTGRLLSALAGRNRMLALTRIDPGPDPRQQAERLLRPGSARFAAVIFPDDDPPSILHRPGVGTTALTALLIRARDREALAAAGLDEAVAEIEATRPRIATTRVDGDADTAADDTADEAGPLATGAAVVLFTLISLLAGALLSNMVEEKGNKVIEILVAAVPIPSIFAGKLLGMLFVSLLGVAVWGLMFGGGAALVLSQLPDGVLPDPARGWPAFIALVLAYFVTAYLIYGALYLGIGSLCTSIREVQTLSMPVTILQMVILIWTLGTIDDPQGIGGTIASWFPLSAPYMMAARAGIDADIAVHVAALSWQVLFAAIIIFAAARLFRYGVLRSGPPPSPKDLLRSAKYWLRRDGRRTMANKTPQPAE
ncbi:MAG: ABC transporter permease, partial [Pseudomonadota bacterium]